MCNFLQGLEKFTHIDFFMQSRTSTWDCLALPKCVVSLCLHHHEDIQLIWAAWTEFIFSFERKVEHLNYNFLLYSNCSDSLTSVNHLSKLLHGNLPYFNYGTVITTDKKWKSSLFGITMTQSGKWLYDWVVVA